MKITYIILGFLAILALIILSIGMWTLGSYNGFISGQQIVETSWAQVESQYQRRFDLIPGLVEATKSILKQEQKVFGDIANARTHYAGTSSGTEERVEATNQMESALSRLMVIIENYPQLNSDKTVQALMDELSGTENRINIARERYNDSVKEWNIRVKSFPGSIIASIFNFGGKELFKSETDANKAVKINLDL
jgi:LemA protein